MAKRKSTLGYHRVRVTCGEFIDQPRAYTAGLTEEHRRDGIMCAKCGEVVPHEGNGNHEVAKAGRLEA